MSIFSKIFKGDKMELKKEFTLEEAKMIAKKLGVKFDKFDAEQFRMGVNVELEHGTRNKKTNVTNDDPLLTGKVALAHLTEFPDYYTRLLKLEQDAEDYWSKIL